MLPPFKPARLPTYLGLSKVLSLGKYNSDRPAPDCANDQVSARSAHLTPNPDNKLHPPLLKSHP
jgi:hypothetical protein